MPVRPADKIVTATDYSKLLSGEKTVGYTNIKYVLNDLWHNNEPYGQVGKSTFNLPEAGMNDNPGHPMLPREGLFIAIPSNATITSVGVNENTKTIMNGKFDILPVPKPNLEGERLMFEQSSDIYDSDSDYPAISIEYAGDINVFGITCAHFLFSPLRYTPANGKIAAITQATIRVNYELNKNPEETAAVETLTQPHFAEQLLGYDIMSETSNLPRLLILTNQDLSGAMDKYREAKSAKYTVETVFYEDIVTSPDDDAPELIYNFLKKYHTEKPIRHLVIGGEVNIIPTKLLVDEAKPLDPKVASDSYYCIDTANDNYIPRFSISRFPASNVAELSGLCALALEYPTVSKDKRETAIFTTFSDNKTKVYDECKDDICTAVEASGRGINIQKYYDKSCSKKDLINAINYGVGFINYRGHGAWDRWQSSIGLNTMDVGNLRLGSDTPHVLSVTCCNSAIHLYPELCFGAAWIRQLKAISFLGTSAATYTTENNFFDKFLWEAICPPNIKTAGLSVIGDIYFQAIVNFVRQFPANSRAQANIKKYLLLGDGTADYLEQSA
jgi:hypothetical protein